MLSLFSFANPDFPFFFSFPTTNGGMQNGSSVGIFTHCMHFFACLVLICMLSRCLLTKFLQRSSLRKFIKGALLVGSSACVSDSQEEIRISPQFHLPRRKKNKLTWICIIIFYPPQGFPCDPHIFLPHMFVKTYFFFSLVWKKTICPKRVTQFMRSSSQFPR